MLFFCFVAASGPSQEQHQLHPSRASPEREAHIREAYTAAHELAAGVAREQAVIDTMNLETIDAEMSRLLQRRDMLCNSAERTVQQNGTTSSDILCNSTAFVPRALELSAQRQDGADAVTSSDASAGRDPGAELCPGHPHILRSSPTCLEKTAADPSEARLTGSKKHDGASVSPKAQADEDPEKKQEQEKEQEKAQADEDPEKKPEQQKQQQKQQEQEQKHGIGQQGTSEAAEQQGQQGEQEKKEALEEKVTDMEVVLVICMILISLTMFFEWLRHYLQRHTPHMMSNILTALFGELTVLGFIAVFTFFLLASGFMHYMSNQIYHESDRLIELFEAVHFDLFFVMIIFLVQALLLVNSLMRAIKYWHSNYRDLREDRWCHACAELREAYRARTEGPLWRRVLLWPYHVYRIDTLRKEVRIFLLRERFVSPPASVACLVDAGGDPPLSDMFNFAAYLRRRAADTAGEMLNMTPFTWFVVGFFMVSVIQVLVFLEFAAGHRGDLIEGNVMEAMSWIMLMLVMALFYRLHWTLRQLTPAHPLLKGLDDHGGHADAITLMWGGGEDGKPAFDPILKTVSSSQEHDGSRPDRKWIDAEAPYERRAIVKGKSKMESLFPFGGKRADGSSKGQTFYVFAVRTLLFSTAILFCLCVQWIPLSATPHDMLVRIFLSAVPLLMIIVIAPTKLLPLVVMVTSIEQLKNRHDIAETIVEMKAESALQTLRALSVVLTQAVRAKKIGERLQEDEAQKTGGCVAVSCIGPKDDEVCATTTSGRETAKKRLVLNQQHLSELRATFVCFDKDGSGDIDVAEFSMMMNTLGVRLAPKIVSRMFDEMDHNKDSRVEFDEFVEYMVTHGFTSRAESDGPAEIVDCVFEMLDEDKSGSVSSSELRAMMASFGENACEADTTMQMFDLDGSGTITKAELLKAVEMMHTFAAGRRDSKRRVITNAAGGLVVVAAELVDDELDTIAETIGVHAA